MVNVKVTPDATSFTFIGNTEEDGATTVVPEAVHEGTVTPAQRNEQAPPKQPLQSTDVVVLAHV